MFKIELLTEEEYKAHLRKMLPQAIGNGVSWNGFIGPKYEELMNKWYEYWLRNR